MDPTKDAERYNVPDASVGKDPLVITQKDAKPSVNAPQVEVSDLS